MAIAIAMNINNTNNSTQEEEEDNNNNANKHEDEHENDVVMPGFRFHPTEEELVEFYLRRKVEGKRFNVELITFLDLYRYDPWELPALAAIGEKEWYFYVPRDRKYRNGDRPNRVTTSGYWKATGADRMIRSESSRSIGLKKTLVFYSGKAPKGIRTSWIMNEYRLPHHETERLQKAEISLCRVYKRAGVEDHPSLPRVIQTSRAAAASSSISMSQPALKQDEPTSHQGSFQPNYGEMSQQQQTSGKLSDTSPSSSADVGTSLSLSKHSHSNTPYSMSPLVPMASSSLVVHDDDHMLNQSHTIDDLHKLVSNYSSSQQVLPINHPHHQYHVNNVPNVPSHFSTTFQPDDHPQPLPQSQPMATLNVPPGSVQGGFSDRLWDWSGISEAAGKDFTNLFK